MAHHGGGWSVVGNKNEVKKRNSNFKIIKGFLGMSSSFTKDHAMMEASFTLPIVMVVDA
jgi:hypothetical protein